MDKYKQFTEVSYSGRGLLKEHSLNTEGVWQIYGEDPNCDMGGHHHEPLLGVYLGKLKDIITIAVELPGFWAWGGGGRIKLIKIQEITPKSTEEYIAKKKRIQELEKELAVLKKDVNPS